MSKGLQKAFAGTCLRAEFSLYFWIIERHIPHRSSHSSKDQPDIGLSVANQCHKQILLHLQKNNAQFRRLFGSWWHSHIYISYSISFLFLKRFVDALTVVHSSLIFIRLCFLSTLEYRMSMGVLVSRWEGAAIMMPKVPESLKNSQLSNWLFYNELLKKTILVARFFHLWYMKVFVLPSTITVFKTCLAV